MRHEQATRLRTPGSGDVWWTCTARGRTRSNAIARLRPVPDSRKSYPSIAYLAAAVLHRAVEDATPMVARGGHARDKYANTVLLRQCEALIWLSSSDPDLQYWLYHVGRSLRELHDRYQPMLLEFLTAHPTVAAKFSLPEWARPYVQFGHAE